MKNILRYLGEGSYHTDMGLPCQDFLDFAVTEKGRVVLALSDGCGSSLYANVASETVVKFIIEYFSDDKNRLSDDVSMKKHLLEHLNRELFKKAEEHSYPDTYEFCATMIFAVVEDNQILIGHIGDGALMCYGEKGEILFESAAENGGASNITYFVNSYDAFDHFRLDLLELEDESALKNLVMFSDGPQKMFDNHIEENISEGVISLVEKVSNKEITDCTQLRNHLHEIFVNSTNNIFDDWSLMILDTDQPQCKDFDSEPVCMEMVFYEKYRKNNPSYNRYVEWKLDKIRRIRRPVKSEKSEEENSNFAFEGAATGETHPEVSASVGYDERADREEDREDAEFFVMEDEVDYYDSEEPIYGSCEIESFFSIERDFGNTSVRESADWEEIDEEEYKKEFKNKKGFFGRFKRKVMELLLEENEDG